MYVFHVAEPGSPAWRFTEEVSLNGKSLGPLAVQAGGETARCEYAVQTVPSGPIRVVARPWLALPGGSEATDAVAVEHVASSGAQYFVRLRSGPRAPAKTEDTNGRAAAFAGAHALEVIAAATPPADLTACERPRTPDAPSYDQAVLDQILPCMHEVEEPAEPSPFAAAVCGCWSQHSAAAGDPLTLSISVGAKGRVDAVRVDPAGALATCLERDVPSTQLPEPPAGPREVTIRLRTGS